MDLINKRIKIYYSDGKDVQCRIGTLSGETPEFFVIEGNVFISRDRVVRVELAGDRQ